MRIARLLPCALPLVVACNGLTGVADYKNVDDTCDGGCAASDGGESDSGGSDAGIADGPPASCPNSDDYVVTLTVKGTQGRVFSNPGGLDVTTGQMAWTCFHLGVEIQLSPDNANGAAWSGVQCNDGPRRDRCRFNVPPMRVDVGASLL